MCDLLGLCGLCLEMTALLTSATWRIQNQKARRSGGKRRAKSKAMKFAFRMTMRNQASYSKYNNHGSAVARNYLAWHNLLILAFSAMIAASVSAVSCREAIMVLATEQ